MYIYLLVGLLIFGGYFLKIDKKKYISFIFIVLFVFTAFRNPYQSGTDGLSYLAFFEHYVPKLSEISTYDYMYEFGYMLLNSIAKTIRNDYFFFRVFYAAFAVWLLSLVVKKMKVSYNEKLLFLFVYFSFRYFQNTMEFLRNNISYLFVWIAFLSLDDIAQKKKFAKLKVLSLVWLAYLFHRSSIIIVLVLLAVWFLRKIDKKLLAIGTVIVSGVCYLLPISVLNRFINFAASVGGERYESYFLEGNNDYYEINIINYLLRLVFFLMIAFGYNLIDYKNKDFLLAIASITVIIGSLNAGVFTRFVEYGMVSIYLCITLSVQMFEKKSKELYRLMIYIAFTTILVRNLHTISGGSYLNWQFYLG